MADEKTLLQQIEEEAQLLQLTLIRQARVRAEAVLGATAATGQTSSHQTSENISQQAGRTQSETSHLDDMNAGERMKLAVARGADDNQVTSQALNGVVTGIAQVAGFGVQTQMIGASVACNQMYQNTVDLNHKNSNFGRGMGVYGLLAVGDAVEEASNDTDKA